MLSPLALALPAMTALQATVALGVFALSVLAPQLGLSVAQLALLNTVLFGAGAISALLAGRLLKRCGDWPLAALCAACIAAGMLCLMVGGPVAVTLAALLFGLAFGPETPASASVLSRVTPAARRPWIFSVRQTGNQIGALSGSLLLPVLMVWHAQLPYAVVTLLAMAMCAWCLALSRNSRVNAACAAAPSATRGPAAAAWRTVIGSRALRALAFAALGYTAVQVCLNTFLMSLLVRDWQLDVASASIRVAWMQGAGLVGRLFWGGWAQRSPRASRLLGVIGLLMATCGAVVMLWPAARSGAIAALLIGLLGFSASGWNGVLVAEVSRIAGPHAAGSLTGAVLMLSYAGLALAPLAFAGFSSAVSMTGAFLLLFGAAAIAALMLLATPAASEPHRGQAPCTSAAPRP